MKRPRQSDDGLDAVFPTSFRFGGMSKVDEEEEFQQHRGGDDEDDASLALRTTASLERQLNHQMNNPNRVVVFPLPSVVMMTSGSRERMAPSCSTQKEAIQIQANNQQTYQRSLDESSNKLSTNSKGSRRTEPDPGDTPLLSIKSTSRTSTTSPPLLPPKSNSYRLPPKRKLSSKRTNSNSSNTATRTSSLSSSSSARTSSAAEKITATRQPKRSSSKQLLHANKTMETASSSELNSRSSSSSSLQTAKTNSKQGLEAPKEKSSSSRSNGHDNIQKTSNESESKPLLGSPGRSTAKPSNKSAMPSPSRSSSSSGSETRSDSHKKPMSTTLTSPPRRKSSRAPNSKPILPAPSETNLKVNTDFHSSSSSRPSFDGESPATTAALSEDDSHNHHRSNEPPLAASNTELLHWALRQNELDKKRRRRKRRHGSRSEGSGSGDEDEETGGGEGNDGSDSNNGKRWWQRKTCNIQLGVCVGCLFAVLVTVTAVLLVLWWTRDQSTKGQKVRPPERPPPPPMEGGDGGGGADVPGTSSDNTTQLSSTQSPSSSKLSDSPTSSPVGSTTESPSIATPAEDVFEVVTLENTNPTYQQPIASYWLPPSSTPTAFSNPTPTSTGQNSNDEQSALGAMMYEPGTKMPSTSPSTTVLPSSVPSSDDTLPPAAGITNVPDVLVPDLLQDSDENNAQKLLRTSLVLDAIQSIASWETEPSVLDGPRQDALDWLLEDTYPSVTVEEVQQRYLWALFYFSTNGDHWGSSVGFLDSSQPICGWHDAAGSGIVCDGTGLLSLELPKHNLQGTLMPEMNKLASVQSINLMENDLGGELPPGLLDGSLPQLTSLTLGRNGVGGSLPDTFHAATALEVLDLGHTGLVGTLPEMNGMAALRSLNLQWTEITGTLPVSMTSLMNLERLNLQHNALNGTLELLGSLPNLADINVAENQFMGGLPGFVSTKLEKIQLSSNQLSGSVTPFLESLSLSGMSLQWLWLDSNQITGTIPESISDLSGLNQCSIADNEISGTIPTAIGSLSNLEFSLNFQNNRLSGTIPSELSQLTNIEWVDLSQNELTGGIPNELGGNTGNGGAPSSLKGLILRWNQLEGTVPPFLNMLDYAAIQGNHLTGEVVCPIQGHIEADCPQQVQCPCCQLCCDEEGNCSAPAASLP